MVFISASKLKIYPKGFNDEFKTKFSWKIGVYKYFN